MIDREKSLEHILKDFNPREAVEAREETTLTIWISAKDKDRYKRLQQLSKRSFAKKLREVVLATLDMAEAKAS